MILTLDSHAARRKVHTRPAQHTRVIQVRAITAPQNLHAIIAAVSHYNIALPVQCNAAPSADLRWTAAVAAHAARVSAVAHTKHFNTAVDNELVLL
jgi:hypothetical protein